MKKTITKLMSFSLALVITFGLTIMPNQAKADVAFTKKKWVSIYGSYIYGGLEVFGFEVPVGFTLDGGKDYLGEKEDCVYFYLSWCDDSNLQVKYIQFVQPI
jgi:hypothetical protein